MSNSNKDELHYCTKEREIDRLISKTDQVIDTISDIRASLSSQREILSSQKIILEDHVARTKIAEKRLDRLESPYKIMAYVATPLALIITIISILKMIL